MEVAAVAGHSSGHLDHPTTQQPQQPQGDDVDAASGTSSSDVCLLLECTEALPGIVAHLDGRALAILRVTCKSFRDILDGDDGRRWWRRLGRQLLAGTRRVLKNRVLVERIEQWVSFSLCSYTMKT